MLHDYFQKKKWFDLLTKVLGVSVGKIFSTMLLSFDMQHDHIPKKFNFGVAPPPPPPPPLFGLCFPEINALFPPIPKNPWEGLKRMCAY